MAAKVKCLQDIEKIKHNIRTAQTTTIRVLHRLIFEKEGKDRGVRQRLREFTGFTFERDSEQHQLKMEFIDKEFSDADLVAVCMFLGAEYSGEKATLVHRVCDNLMDLSWLEITDDEEDDEEEDEDNEGKDDRATLEEKVRALKAQLARMSVKKGGPRSSGSSSSSDQEETDELKDVKRKKKVSLRVTRKVRMRKMAAGHVR